MNEAELNLADTLRSHNPAFTESDRARFWDGVPEWTKTGDCWEWELGTFRQGYGRLYVRRKSMLAHRISYELNVGPIPEGMFVCHKCDNPPCVNPSHLFLGTALDNMRDKVSKGRHGNVSGDDHHSRCRPETVLRGVRHWNSKLTEDDVLRIHALHAGGMIQRRLCERFNASPQTVSAILKGIKWKHLHPSKAQPN